MKNDLQALCFTDSRKMAELVTLWAREDALRSSSQRADAICAHTVRGTFLMTGGQSRRVSRMGL